MFDEHLNVLSIEKVKKQHHILMFASASFQLRATNGVLFALELLREIEQNEVVEEMGSISCSHYNFRDGFVCNAPKMHAHVNNLKEIALKKIQQFSSTFK